MFEERGVSKRRAPSSFLFLLENMARYAGYFPDGPVITTNYPDIARNWPKYPYIAEYCTIFSHIEEGQTGSLHILPDICYIDEAQVG